MTHPFSQETVTKLADELLNDLISNSDLNEEFNELVSKLVEKYIPYTSGENSSADDLHCEISGLIVNELVKYVLLGRGYHISR